MDALTVGVAEAMDKLELQHQEGEVDDIVFLEQLDSILQDYKSEVSGLILGNPSSGCLLRGVPKDQRLPDIRSYNKQDYPCLAQWPPRGTGITRHGTYPAPARFHNEALRARRQQEQQDALFANIPIEEEGGLPDIELREVNGQGALSSLKGKWCCWIL